MKRTLNMAPALRGTAVTALLVSGIAHAGDCQYAIEGSDDMQYNQSQLRVPETCKTVELTLKHSGQQPINVIGHNWVLAKSSDLNSVVAGGLNAGRANNYQAPNDP